MTRDESFRQVAPILARALQRIRPDIAGGVDVPVPAGPPPLALGKRSSVDTARDARVRPVSVHRGDPGVGSP